ncbi:Farnesyl diphosphate synthase [Sinobacterium norvegicum]|uniref:Farnesyl diphosphate synthase n=1 Tax=Sinobacterium norvegicum TaxID=1641715 RepID=A0ABM9AEB7_9GAMM|nr:farnesyl diphosphate synthase [Sinobacterium norvegicum]CAH0991542.1 Farnesyl diphosphate synthase [Sinobacterium norvegicum]
MSSLNQQLQHAQQRINSSLSAELEAPVSPYSEGAGDNLGRVYQAIQYSVMNGGKRMRPLLVFASADAVLAGRKQTSKSLDLSACAIEFIHCYSLVHDDLPAMDDDDLRRGQPTVHKAFDDATAILSGDALQAMAFEALSRADDIPPAQQIALVKELALAAGPVGMVGGQALDIAATDQRVNLEQLEQMHSLKTGALIRAAVAMGAICAGASEQQRIALDHYARAVGLAFQVHDDILDVESDTTTLGKTAGADIALNKSTYPALLGLSQAKDMAQQLLQQALTALKDFDEHADTLRQLAHYAVTRNH